MDDNQAQNAILNKVISKYRKTLLINLTENAFEIVNLADDERKALKENNILTFAEYWTWFCDSELLHKDYRADCLQCSFDPGTAMIYKRRINNDWRTMLMEVIALDDYQENNKKCMLSVRDITDIYKHEYDKVVEKIGTTDTLTGLLNKLAFKRDCSKIADGYVGCMYCDLNGLKYTNDNYGHDAGDILIVNFANLLSIHFKDYRCYHLSGDEFAVISYGKNVREFLSKAIGFHKSIWIAQEVPMAAVGYSIGDASELEEIVKESERQMYEDKDIFRVKFPQFIRK